MGDRLSQLPDELIVSILSQLTIRKAVQTSSLSTQWHYLWMHVTRLNFDVSQFITWKICYYPRLCRKEGMKHINLINNVLDFHKGAHLEEFTLSFPFHKHFKHVIDKCLNFVVSKKKIEIFQLDLSLSKNELRRYTFPFKLIPSFRSTLSPFVSLKVLAFNNVDVDNRVVNFFIFNCPLLEKLSIHQSILLIHLEIVGPLCFNLKDLELCHCINLDFIKIHNVNLVSFKYIGKKPNLLLENVTSILTADFKMTQALICELVHTFTTYFTRLTTLSLEFCHMWMDLRFLDHALPKFNNLKVLVLKLSGMEDVSLLGITPLIEASPYLQKLHIELYFTYPLFFFFSLSGLKRRSPKKKKIIRKKCPHQHLKEVKYSGYIGCFADMILTTYLIENSVALEIFIIDPYKYVAQSRGRARQQLPGKIPKRVKLVIL
ncbi:hypothetical protein R3W88_031623 [Solanum pinnatisectum]|uniref:F-box domain-containing protein n=1 Tax=Solanum pinnatisectum TaxID=50273 RepID=A0AAV9LLV3_9SOLN|nr:hypothetical protein R3W88_031623 [Solanum pinnatisectum]